MRANKRQGEVSMTKKSLKFLKSGWKRRVSLVLIFTILFVIFMHEGWYRPKLSEATGTTNGRIVHSQNTATPLDKSYAANTSTFAAGATMTAGAAAPTWIVNKACPTRDEYMSGYVTTGGVLHIYKFDGTSWIEVTNTAAPGGWGVGTRPTVGGDGVNGRRFDIAYEQSSGRAMVVYSKNATGSAGNEMGYRIWDGSTWTAEGLINSANLTRSVANNAVAWIKLASRPGSNEIALAAVDNGNAVLNTATLTAFIWSGSAWGNEPGTALDTTYSCSATITTGVQYDNFDLAYESQSGELMVVWSYQHTATNANSYATYSGGAWSGKTAMPGTAVAALQTYIAPNPRTNQLLAMIYRSANTAAGVGFIYDGSAWGTRTALGATTTSQTTTNKKFITGQWLNVSGTDYAVALTVTSTAGTISYNRYTGAAWGVAATNATGQAFADQWIDSDVDPFVPDTLMLHLSYTNTTNFVLARRLVLTAGPTFTWTTPTGSPVGNALTNVTTQNFDFRYKRYAELTVGDGANPGSRLAAQGATNVAMNAFTLQSTKNGTVSTLTISGSANFTSTNVSAIRIYRDNGVLGTYESGTDVLVPSTTAWATNVATITITTPENVTNTAVNYLVVIDIAATATVNNTLFGTITQAATTLNPKYSDIGSATITIRTSGLLVSDGSNPNDAIVPQGSTNKAMNSFVLSMGAGTGSVSTLTLTGGAQFVSTNVSAIRIYRDNGVLGTYESGTDVLVPSTTAWAANVATLTITTPESVSTTAVNYLIVIDIQAAATVGNTLWGTITAATGTTLGTPQYADSNSGNLTVRTSGLMVSDGTNPISAIAPQSSTNKAMNSFVLSMGAGTGTVNTLTLTGSAQFVTANVSAIRIYRDNGVVGTYESGTDVQVTTSTAWAANVATITITGGESVSTTAVNYLVVIDIAAAATIGNTLSGRITAATGTTLGTPQYADASSATLTVVTSALTVAEGLNPIGANAPQASINNAMNAFLMYCSSCSVNTLTLTGSTNFTTTNVTKITIYRDYGVKGTLDAADVLVPTTYTHTATNATITFTTAESVTSSPVNYLVVVDVAAAATIGNTLSGRITAATGTGLGTPVYNDSISGALTITAGPTLTIGNGTDPVIANALIGSHDNALDAFTTALSFNNSGKLQTITFTGSLNFTAANIKNIKIYCDRPVLGTLGSGDLAVPITYSLAGSVATITLTNPEDITSTAKNYIVAVDMMPNIAGTSVGLTFTGTVTAVTGSGWAGTPTYSDAGSATLTIAKAAATNTSCSSCHGYTSLFPDGTARNNPDGTFIGSHQTHVGEYAIVCSKCHTTPLTELPGDYGHRNGTIMMANPINGDTGGAYGKGASWAQINPPAAMQACSSVYCHSQGTGNTSQAGDTRSMSTPLASLNWGSPGACSSCHGYPPSYANGATTWGAAKANSHGSHTTNCSVCHNLTTTDNVSISGTTQHGDKNYDISSASIGSYTYNVSGGTCTNIACHRDGSGTSDPSRQWGTTLPKTSYDCVKCHNVTQAITRGPLSGIASRRAVSVEFTKTWSHKRSAGGAVTKYDCCVCHMEGDMTTGDPDSSYHQDGYIDLRDPDTGEQIKNVTFGGTGAGSYTSGLTNVKFAKFSRDLSKTLESDPYFEVVSAIQINLCLKCHDANGAASPLARVPTTGTAMQPFGVAITGHVAPYNTNGNGNVVDVNGSFATTNSSYHPVRGRQNNSYTQGTTYMVAPWTLAKTNGNNTQWGNLISCWDCHAASGASGPQSSTVTAHGDAVTLRAPVRQAGTTAAANLCINCHGTTYANPTGDNHGTGSAFGTGGGGGMGSSYFPNCSYCHAYGPEGGANMATATNRPLRGEDAHGFNDRVAGTAGSLWTTSGVRPYGFIRNILQIWSPLTASEGTPTHTCTGGSAGNPCNNNMTGDSYTPGGSY